MKILLIYYSKSGNTLDAVNAIVQGIEAASGTVDVIAVDECDATQLISYDSIIFASPCWAGALGGSGIAKPMKKFTDSLAENSLQGKRCGGISVHAKTGGKNTVYSLKKIAIEKGCNDFICGPACKAGSSLSLWKGKELKEEDIAKYKQYGSEFVSKI